MNKLFYIFFVSYLLTSCLAEQNNPLLTIPTCADGIRNQNEEEIDCGGVCEACEIYVPIEVPCKSSLTDNQISLGDSKLNLTDDVYSCTNYENAYEIYIWDGVSEIIIDIYDVLPTKPKKYNLVRWFDLENGYASIKVTQFYNYTSTHGELYVSPENGKWTVEFCENDLIGQEATVLTVKGRITCAF